MITPKIIKKKKSTRNKRIITKDLKNIKDYEQVYAKRLDNLDGWTNSLMSTHQEKIDKCLEEGHTLPKVTQAEIENLNIPVSLT